MRFWSTVSAEMIKVRRSAVWIIVTVLPLLAVFSGSINYVFNDGVLSRGWDSLWSQVVLFYGLLFCSIAISILASAMWRMEHRGNNWNRLLDTPVGHLTLLGAKAIVLLGLVAAMQAVLLAMTLGVGSAVLHVPGPLPGQLPLISLVAVFACCGVVGLQLLLSMVLRSFAAPVALGLVGAIVGVGVTLSGNIAGASVVPQALVLRSLSMGSRAMSNAEPVAVSSIASLIGPALALGLASLVVAAGWLRSRDIR